MLPTLHLLLLCGFVGVTCLLLALTVESRMRIRKPAVRWRTGRLGGWPLWPTLFLFGLGSVLIYAALAPLPVAPGTALAYVLGGLAWFAAAALGAQVFVTDGGIVPGQGRRGITWAQVTDYFSGPCGDHYVFFYQDENGHRQRLELDVPLAHREAFAHVVRAKLDARFDHAVEQAYGGRVAERRRR